ncbi:MAG TPA: hypothetical protein VFS58_10655, partial [Steroidobacteraceae bacterium]|nr:hypothetical protein [Steroidobacteraceae bacterium]
LGKARAIPEKIATKQQLDQFNRFRPTDSARAFQPERRHITTAVPQHIAQTIAANGVSLVVEWQHPSW